MLLSRIRGRILAETMAATTTSTTTVAATTTSSAASDLDPAITNMQPSEEAVHDCPVDEAGDMDDPNNLYTCLEAEECCTVDLNPACCAKKEAADEM